MSKYPKVKLVEDPARDAKLGVNFVKNHLSGYSRMRLKKFLPDELLDVLKERMPAKERDRRVRTFAIKRHRAERARILRNLRLIRRDWARVEGKYFRLVDKIFKNHSWPKGKYIGYVTVFWMYPRDINEKTFYFPYKHRLPHYANKVIAHEMLHFIFFEYVKSKFGTDWKKEKNYGKLWKVSEAFNAMIENWASYKKFFIYGGKPYTGTEKIFRTMTRDWSRSKDINKLLAKWLKK